jgi:hypothetical protein
VTNTQTPTNTATPTVTPTNTATQTQTPTSTQEPICPEQLILTQTSPTSLSGYTGTYNRLYSWSGGTFNYAYYNTVAENWVFDTADFAGRFGVVYGRFDGINYYTIYIVAQTIITPTIGTYLINLRTDNYSVGLSPLSNQIVLDFTTFIISNVIYPIGSGSNNFYIAYPEICPTATPTATPTRTPTPSVTQTNTPTNTQTSTPTGTISSTATPTNTSTPTPTSFTQFGGSGRGNSVAEACSDAISNNRTFYSNCDGLTFGVGCYVYTDSSGTPLTGYTNVFMNLTSWDVNSSTGEITAVSSVQC